VDARRPDATQFLNVIGTELGWLSRKTGGAWPFSPPDGLPIWLRESSSFDQLGRKRLFVITLAVHLIGSGLTAFTLGNSAAWVGVRGAHR
jgi:hypothetical protein